MKTLFAWFVLTLCSYSVYAQQIIVLGIAQDGGYPHLGCKKECCRKAWKNPANKRFVVSLALVDSLNHKWWLFEATPDIKEQLQYFQSLTKGKYNYLPDGIFITHAHIGHYTGLMQLGREVMGTKDVPVYVMPKMKSYLENNGPWSQLVNLHNIELLPLQEESPNIVSSGISITAFIIPHRDEYSETAGFKINTINKSYLFIPDINKWAKWDKDIITQVNSVDYALLDATFYNEKELPGKRMDEVPHPFCVETMKLFEQQDRQTKSKIYFIHFNHTNPLLWDVKQQATLKNTGYKLATQGMKL
ncbi:MAG: pyrroloquinoline quinone biosynthesis protein PqqB [Bacteroidetes bacterium]|nr:pyrroloquinoline quinone biosynthesis protein PqqB [Bacteroidota bacterium]